LFLILKRIAAQANAHQRAREIKVSPHVLRHTFLRKLAEEKGVQYAKEASGHRSDQYIWRYVKPDRQSLADAIDALECLRFTERPCIRLAALSAATAVFVPGG
jgi:integrase/recombinase XerD